MHIQIEGNKGIVNNAPVAQMTTLATEFFQKEGLIGRVTIRLIRQISQGTRGDSITLHSQDGNGFRTSIQAGERRYRCFLTTEQPSDFLILEKLTGKGNAVPVSAKLMQSSMEPVRNIFKNERKLQAILQSIKDRHGENVTVPVDLLTAGLVSDLKLGCPPGHLGVIIRNLRDRGYLSLIGTTPRKSYKLTSMSAVVSSTGKRTIDTPAAEAKTSSLQDAIINLEAKERRLIKISAEITEHERVIDALRSEARSLESDTEKLKEIRRLLLAKDVGTGS